MARTCTDVEGMMMIIVTMVIDLQVRYCLLLQCRCSTYVKARKQLSLHEVPNILTIVLKRFQVVFHLHLLVPAGEKGRFSRG